MKALRVVLIIVLLLIIVGGGAIAWFFMSRAQVAPATALVPAKTLAFAHIPNGVDTGLSYRGSKLAEIIDSDEIKAIASLAWAKMMESATDMDEEDLERMGRIMENFSHNFSGESFIAVTDVQMDPSVLEPVGLVMGFHPLQGSGSFDAMVNEIKQAMEKSQGEEKLTTGSGSYGGLSYDYVEPPDGTSRFYICKTGSWILVATKEDLLKGTIDRLQGKDKSPSLQDSADYKKTLEAFDPAPQLVTYINFTGFYELMIQAMKMAAQMPGSSPEEAEMVEKMLDFYRSIKTVSLGSNFTSDGLMRDQWISMVTPDFISAMGGMVAPCKYETMRFTDKSTILYLGSSLDAPAYFKFTMDLYKGIPEMANAQQMVEGMLQQFGLDLHENILNALGEEYAVISSWPKAEQVPFAGFVVTLKDQKAFQPTYELIVQSLKTYTAPMEGGGQSAGRVLTSKLNNYELTTYEMPDSPMAPTIVFGDNLIGIFISQKGAATILASPADSNFTQFDKWKELNLDYKGSSQLMYLDMHEVLERSYAMASPMIQMMVAMDPSIQEQLGDFEIPGKLEFLKAVTAMGQVTFNKDPMMEQVSVSTFGSPLIIMSVGAIAVLQQLGQQVTNTFDDIDSQLDEATDPSMDPGLQDAPPEAEVDPKSPEAIRDELSDLRVVIKAWAQQNNVPEGATVEWDAIKGYLIPGTRLADSDGKDALGNPFKLGRVGEIPPGVSNETKNAFPDLPPGFWSGDASAPAPTQPATEAPAEAPAQ